MVHSVDVEKVFANLKEFDEDKYMVSGSQFEKQGWPKLTYPVDDPKIVSVAEARSWIRDDDYVLGLAINGQSRAYPLILNNYYHQVNDILGGEPVLVND